MANALVRTSANEFIRMPDSARRESARSCPTELVIQRVSR